LSRKSGIVHIWWGVVLYKNNQKENLRWDLQRIILTLITILFAYKNSKTIHYDLYDLCIYYEPFQTEFFKFWIYPFLLLVYYITLFIVYYFKNLKGKNIKEVFLNSNPTGRKYIQFSRFILASMFFSIAWVLAVWLSIILGSFVQH